MTGASAGGIHRLILLRHAKAESAGTLPDVLRPLALVGRKQAGRVGAALYAAGLVPEQVWCSAALRTRQTWDLAQSRFGDAEPEVVISDELYSAGVGDVLGLVRSVDSRVRTVLVVGHEPTMAATAERLADLSESDAGAVAQVRVGVPTATYAVLESAISWSGWIPGTAVLTYVSGPE